MTRARYWTLICLLFAFAFALPSCQSVKRDHGSNGTEISGIVIHGTTGKPVANITVTLGTISPLVGRQKIVVPYVQGDQAFEDVTDQSGRFRFTGIAQGNVLLMIQDETMAAKDGEIPLEVSPDQQHIEIELKVTEGASISGTIFNDGYYHGVEGVEVQVVPYYDQREEWVRTYYGMTQADGSFHIGGIPSGNYEVRSSPVDGFQQTSIPFHGEDPVCQQTYFQGFPMRWATHYAPFEFTVAQGALARGMVVDEEGNPVAGASVYRFSGGSSNSGVLTDAQGEFLLWDWEKPELPSIMAQKDGQFSEWLRSEETLEDFGPIRLTLRPGARLHVNVVDENGDPVSWPFEVDIDLSYQGANSSPYERATLEASGSFAFPILPPATYRLGVRGPHRDYVQENLKELELHSGDDTELTLVATNTSELLGPDITGRVINVDGLPVPGAAITSTESDPYETTTAPDGSFVFRTRTIESLPSYVNSESVEKIDLRVSANGYKELSLTAAPGDGPLRIALERAPIVRGHVVDVRTGKALEEYTAIAYHSSDPGNSSRPYWKEIKNTKLTRLPGGLFAITGIAVPEFILEVDTPAHQRTHEILKLKTDSSADPVLFRLNPAGHLSGQIVDVRGNPVSSANLFANDLRPRDPVRGVLPIFAESLSGHTTTDSNGAFYLSFETIGAIELCVDSPYPRHCQVVEIPADGLDDLRIVVPDGVMLFGQVTMGGEPLASAKIRMQHAKLLMIYADATTDSDGRFTIEDAPLGENHLSCTPATTSTNLYQRNKSISFEVLPGQRKEVNIDLLPAQANLEGQIDQSQAQEFKSATIQMLLPDGELILTSIPIQEDGSFRASPLPEGDAWVSVRAEGKRRVAVAHLKSGQTTHVNLSDTPGVSVRGTLARNGVAGDLSIVAVPGNPDLTHYGTTFTMLTFIVAKTEVAGDDFVLEDVPTGTITLLCWPAQTYSTQVYPPPIVGRTTIEVGPTGANGVTVPCTPTPTP